MEDAWALETWNSSMRKQMEELARWDPEVQAGNAAPFTGLAQTLDGDVHANLEPNTSGDALDATAVIQATCAPDRGSAVPSLLHLEMSHQEIQDALVDQDA